MRPRVVDRTEQSRRLCEAVRMQVITGTAEAERFYHWSFRALDAERDERDPIGAHKHHLDRMRRLEEDMGDRVGARLAGEHELACARFFHVEADYWLAAAQEDDTEERAVAQVEAARAAESAVRTHQSEAPQPVPAEGPCLWSVRLLQAERDADPERELDHYRSHLDRLLEVERTVRRRPRDGPPRDADVAEFFRWEAEYWLSLITTDTGRRTRRSAFALERLRAARNVYGQLRGGFRVGVGMSDQLYMWSLRWLRATRDQEEEQDESEEEEGPQRQGRSALEEHLERLQTFEAALRASQEIGVALDLGALEYFLAEGRAWIRQARMDADLKATG